MRAVLASILLLLVACSEPPHDTVPTPAPANAYQGIDTAEAYRIAIADYLKAMYHKDGSLPDTLFIGRHDDFPDIQLPAIINSTCIRIVSPSEAMALKNGPHFAYLNIFGWFSPRELEFFAVRFEEGMRHRPDGRYDRHLYYRIGAGQDQFVLDSLSF
jgi:hypothetical protein